MPRLSLEEYRDKIAEQIENGHLEEAIAHCRHILAHYSRYLPVYKLLAHICLEKGDFSHANHFFQCVLSANLEDADAWTNLAQLAQDLGETEQAIWLLERAFEIAPGDTRVRDMLRQLYVQRDGAERTRIKLTPAALARLYARGGLYQRSIRELEKMLLESGSLPRLQVAALEIGLAKALWNTEDRTPLAEQVCDSILQKVPSSLQANLILGDVRARVGRHLEAEPYFRVARMLDPEGELARELLGHRSPLPLQEVEIPYLVYEAPPLEQAQAITPDVEDTSWLDRIGESIEPLALAEDQEAPEWIKTWSDQETLMPTTAESEPPSAEDVGPTRETAPLRREPIRDAEPEVPEWLLEVQREDAGQEADEEIPDWLQELTETEAAQSAPAASPEVQLPGWLQELEPEETDETPTQAVDQLTLKGDLPDWLIELSQSETPHGQPTVSPITDDQVPDRTGEQETLLPDQGQPEKSTRPLRAPMPLEETAQVEQGEESPEWFAELRREAETAAFAEPTPEETGAPAAAPPTEDEVPDWLRELSAEGEVQALDEGVAEATEPSALEEAAIEPVSAAAVTDLVDQEEVMGEPRLVASEEELPGWLQELEAEISGAWAPAAAPQTVMPEASTEPAPTTAAEPVEIVAPEAPVETLPDAEQPDWLRELEEVATQEAVSEAVLEPTPESELPDWIQELRRADETVVAGPAEVEQADLEMEAELEAESELMPDDELPAWLQELGAETESAEAWPLSDTEVEPEILEESPLEPMPDQELPDWLQQLRLAGEPQPDRISAVVEEMELTTEGEPEGELPEPPAMEAAEAVPALSDQLEDLEWLRELEQSEVVEPPEVPVEPEPPAIPVQAPEIEQIPEEPEIARAKARETGPLRAPPEPVAVVPEIEGPPTPSQVLDTESRLSLARARLSENVLDESAAEYERLVREPELAEELIEELERAVQTHPDHHALQRVLGDAYMRTGQLQKALTAYRQALSKL